MHRTDLSIVIGAMREVTAAADERIINQGGSDLSRGLGECGLAGSALVPLRDPRRVTEHMETRPVTMSL